MSAKTDRDRLVAEVERLSRLIAEAQQLAEAQLRNVERLSLKASRTDDAEAALARAHQDRDDAWKRVRVLQQQVLDRDVENTKLAKELEAAVAAQGSMPADLIALKRIVTDHIVESMTGPTWGLVLGRRLRTEMVEAGFPVATEVEIRAQLGGVS
jgi:hypothetical protein